MADELAARLQDVQLPFLAPLPQTPPGMVGDDVELYTRWRQHPHTRTRRAYFNVRVGPRPEDLGETASTDARLAAALGAPRIDLLLDDGDTWWILEFHSQAALPQLGRVLGYRLLLPATYAPVPHLRTAIVAYNCNPFLVPVFDAHQVDVYAYRARGSRPELCTTPHP